jgi:hypothetical protein
MRHLLCDLQLRKGFRTGLNVVQYAAKKSATGLMNEMLQTPYVFANPIVERFEITHLFPDTVPEPSVDSNNDTQNDDVDGGGGSAPPGEKPQSCLELIVNCENVEAAEEMLGLFPFNQLMQGYWVWCQRMYNTLLVAHVVFMAMFTVYVMPTSNFIRRRFNLPLASTDAASVDHDADAAAEKYRVETMPLYGLFLIWPAIIVVMELIAALEYAYRTFRNVEKSKQKRKRRKSAAAALDDDEDEVGFCRCSWKQFRRSMMEAFAFGKLILRGFEYMSHVAALAFCASVVAW